MVAKGYTQKEGLDYSETFSQVAKLVLVKTLLTIASAKWWHLSQIDVSNAFLHGALDEEIYRTPSKGLQPNGDTWVCKLKKSLYRLKQANINWFQKLSTLLTTLGYCQSKVESTLFSLQKSTSYTCILIYVDDIIIADDNQDEIQILKNGFKDQFNINDLGNLKYFLEIEIICS